MALFEHKITATGAPRWLGTGNIAFAPRDSPALETEEWVAAATPPMTMILRLDPLRQDRTEAIKVLEARFVDVAFMLIHTDKLQLPAVAEDVGKILLAAKMFFQRGPLT